MMWARRALIPDYESDSEHEHVTLPIDCPKRKKILVPKTLVLSGGSTKGAAFIGALRALHELGLLSGVKRYVGVSVGSIVASMCCIGYSISEMLDVVLNLDFASLQDIHPRQIFDELGMDKGDKIIARIRELISAKLDPDITLQQVYERTGKSLHIIAVCLNSCKIEVLNHKTEPDLQLWKAIRMSISIPLMFTPVLHKGRLFIDGGCVDNFPMALFPSKDTLGLVLRVEHPDMQVTNVEDVLQQLVKIILSNATHSVNRYPKRTIKIKLPPVSNIDFRMTRETKMILDKIGYQSTMEYYTDTR